MGDLRQRFENFPGKYVETANENHYGSPTHTLVELASICKVQRGHNKVCGNRFR